MKSMQFAFVGYALLFAVAVTIVALSHGPVQAPIERESVTPDGQEAALPLAARPVFAGGVALRSLTERSD